MSAGEIQPASPKTRRWLSRGARWKHPQGPQALRLRLKRGAQALRAGIASLSLPAKCRTSETVYAADDTGATGTQVAKVGDGREIVAVGAMQRRTGGQAAVDSIPGSECAVPVSPSARFD